jgi:hypothetical protein
LNVPVVRLDEFCEERHLAGVDILKLDLQGYELEALKGAIGILPRVHIVFAEVNFVPVYDGQAEFWQLDAFLRAHGFRLFNLYHQSCATEDGQLTACDAMWINSALHPYHAGREPWEADLEASLPAVGEAITPIPPPPPRDAESALTDRAYWDAERSSAFTPWKVASSPYDRLFETHLPRGEGRVCAEIGAYPGAILASLALRLGYEPVAIEYSEHAAHIGRVLEHNGISRYRIQIGRAHV